MSVSIVIGTRDRAGRLARSLEALEKLKRPAAVDWEILIVDNGSSDETARVSRDFSAASAVPRVRYLFEPNRGLSRARNTGIRAARGDIVAFIDDDCYADENWLTAICAAFAPNPSPSGVGGRVELFDPSDASIAVRRSRQPSEMTSIDHLFNLIPGCNMAFRRTALAAVGGFDPRLGPGSPCKAAEDADLIFRLFLSGHRIAYRPDALVRHHHGRQGDDATKAILRAYAIGRGAFYSKHLVNLDRQALRLLYWELSRLARSGANDKPSGHAYPGPILQPCLLLLGAARFAAASIPRVAQSQRSISRG